ncbi:uncharacterized protein H6S33_006418 [Morchella sextelata]|uniref:uncharacterized protein n=1 Tax=Morchella sextelata TaxID=1174677 RepID=UPI001D04A1AB|nr:uncharacterized protein H6S33_006418 [Morchella sextelata]KAH0604750.1 hypothetical protein H6S33_006418 [Morchella sextelata]
MIKTTRPITTTHPYGLPGLIAHSALRTIQLLIALVITGIYGRDLAHASQAHEPADSRWVYAMVVAALTILVSLLFLVPAVRSGRFWPADGVLFFLWMVLFALFGRLYIGEDCEGSGACHRMKTAVWFDLVGMLLWLGSFVGGAFLFWREKHSRTIYTGRGTV